MGIGKYHDFAPRMAASPVSRPRDAQSFLSMDPHMSPWLTGEKTSGTIRRAVVDHQDVTLCRESVFQVIHGIPQPLSLVARSHHHANTRIRRKPVRLALCHANASPP